MSLLFFEGFEGYNNAGDMAQSFWSHNQGVNPSTNFARTGNRGGFAANLNYLRKDLTSAEEHDTIIVGMAVYNLSNNQDQNIFTFGSDSGSTQHIHVSKASGGKIRASRGTRTGTTLAETPDAVMTNLNVWYYVEVKVVLHDSAGSVEIRLNDVDLLSETGIDTKNGGTKSVFDTVWFGQLTSSSNSDDQYFDDIYCCNGAGATNNDFLGDVRVWPLYPDANGTHSDFVGSDGNSTDNYLLVDELVMSSGTSDYVASAVEDAMDTYSFTNLPTGGDVAGVRVIAYANKTDAGAKSLGLVAKVGETEDASPDKSLSTSYIYHDHIWEQNPDTDAAWTASQINSAEFGVKVRP